MVNSRRKGHSWEREVVRRVREALPGTDVRRGLQYRDGADAPDVDVEGWHIECKVGARPNARAALEQAERDAKPGRVPVAVIKHDREPAYVVMRLDAWLGMLRRVGATTPSAPSPDSPAT